MKALLVAGVLYQPFGSFPALSQTDDGVTWDLVVRPFLPLEACTAIATDGNYVIAADNLGFTAITTDMINFSKGVIFPRFSTMNLGYQNSSWIASGQQFYTSSFGPYSAGTEVSQIYRSLSSTGPWEMVWSHPNDNSRMYQLKWFENVPVTDTLLADVWVICGTNNNNGDVWYSLDYGFSWTQALVPAGVGTIFSVELVRGQGDPVWLWGCKGKIFKSSTLHDTEWNEFLVDAADTVVDMLSNDNGMLAISGTNKIYISDNLDNLIRWEYPGYVFNRLAKINSAGKDRWIVFARSILTQFTMWETTDLTVWNPVNNNIHVSGYTLSI